MNPSAHSWRMSRISSRGNRTTEVRFASLLRLEHITGWRRHINLVGKPDFAFRQARIAIFIDGCFWHGCRACNKVPKSHEIFWARKFAYNRERARQVNRELKRRGWYVLRIWEHQLRSPANVIARLRELLGSTNTRGTPQM